jgi:phosphonate transport system substrate-binding protein
VTIFLPIEGIVFSRLRHWSFLILLLGLAAAAPDSARAETLVIGAVAKDVKDELQDVSPLAEYLERRLAPSGIEKVEILILPTAARMGKAFRDGKVHLYFDSPLPAAKVARDGGAVPMLRRWRKGLAEYWSEIIVRSELPVRSLDDLRGHVIAFEDPDSTSGHLLPRAMLLAHGLDLEVLADTDSDFDRSKVGVLVTMGDRAAILSLLSGRVSAIATDPHHVRAIEKERPGAVRSIARSISVPRQVVMRASTMPEPLAREIADILVEMVRSEEGQRVLRSFGKTDRFDAFPQGVEATFEPIHAQLRILDAHGSSPRSVK